jgi:peptidoglycan hydrolase-like protein with peptidoglycan-binding domain
MHSHAMRRWVPAFVAAAVLAVVGITAVAGGSDARTNDATGETVDGSFVPVSEEPVVVDDSTVDSTLPEVETEPSVTAKAKTTLKRTLRRGMVGKDVKRLQQRLVDLGYDPGDVNGKFNSATQTAVWAFEKLVLQTPVNKVTGRVTNKMWVRMQDNLVVKPKRPKGSKVHLEVYLPEQVAILFENKKVRLITHISSGSGKWWEEAVTIDPGEDGNLNGTKPLAAIVRGISITPGGIYKFYRRYVDESTGGWRTGRLGRMYKPVYFNKGLAVHGANEVPNYPASHGCIRIPMHIASYFPDLVKNGDQVYVWDGKKQPEYYGAQPPKADSISRAPTTTTSTTVKKTTTTTVKKTTTTTSSTTTTSGG